MGLPAPVHGGSTLYRFETVIGSNGCQPETMGACSTGDGPLARGGRPKPVAAASYAAPMSVRAPIVGHGAHAARPAHRRLPLLIAVPLWIVVAGLALVALLRLMAWD